MFEKNGDENIHELAARKKLQSKRFYALLLAAFLIFAILAPTFCIAEEERKELTSDKYIILRGDETQKLEQGYEIVLKGFSADTVRLEFYNNNKNSLLIGSAVLKEGETIQCSRITGDGTNDRILVLMMTMDKIYFNNSQVVVGISHVYQFEDPDPSYSENTRWALETAVLEDPSIPGNPKPPEENGDVEEDLIPEPLYIILIFGIAAVSMVAVSIIFRKRVEKQ